MEVVELWRYPVKSTAGLAAAELIMDRWGAEGDRRWAVVDTDGAKVTARTAPRMLALQSFPTAAGVRLQTPSGAALDVVAPVGGPRRPVDFQDLASAIDAGDEAATLLSAHLGRDVRLVWQPDPTERAIAERVGGRPGEVVSLADSAPVLLTSSASLAQLQHWVGPEPALSMRRFRPNVVIDGDLPFAEDDWTMITVGEVTFRVQGCCDRCVLTTIDPDTQAKGKEPIRTLAQHRKWDGATWFGVWLVPERSGRVRVGDDVRPTGAGASHSA